MLIRALKLAPLGPYSCWYAPAACVVIVVNVVIGLEHVVRILLLLMFPVLFIIVVALACDLDVVHIRRYYYCGYWCLTHLLEIIS